MGVLMGRCRNISFEPQLRACTFSAYDISPLKDLVRILHRLYQIFQIACPGFEPCSEALVEMFPIPVRFKNASERKNFTDLN